MYIFISHIVLWSIIKPLHEKCSMKERCKLFKLSKQLFWNSRFHGSAAAIFSEIYETLKLILHKNISRNLFTENPCVEQSVYHKQQSLIIKYS